MQAANRRAHRFCDARHTRFDRTSLDHDRRGPDAMFGMTSGPLFSKRLIVPIIGSLEMVPYVSNRNRTKFWSGLLIIATWLWLYEKKRGEFLPFAALNYTHRRKGVFNGVQYKRSRLFRQWIASGVTGKMQKSRLQRLGSSICQGARPEWQVHKKPSANS